MFKNILIIIIVIIVILAGWWFGKDYIFPEKVIPVSNEQIEDQQNNNQVNSQQSVFTFVNGLSEEDQAKVRNSEEFTLMLKTQQVCSRLSEEDKNDCLADLQIQQLMVVNRLDLCPQTIAEDSCYYYLAVNNSNSQGCNQIADQSLKSDCLNSVYQSQASSQKNINSCASISDESLKDNCYQNIFYQQTDLAFCDEQAVVNNNLKNKCQSLILFNQAVRQGDSAICQQIPLDEYKQSCLAEL